MKNKEAFAFAGIWQEWQNPDNKKKIKTFSIITTDANPFIAKIHNLKMRMPVIFSKQEERLWLEDLSDFEIKGMLDSYPENEMAAHSVSKLITTRGVKRNVPEIIKEFKYDELKTI